MVWHVQPALFGSGLKLHSLTPLPSPESSCKSWPLGVCGAPLWGGRRGKVLQGGGSALQEDSWRSGQWQFRKVNRPQRECCLFFGGGGHEAGPQPRGKSPELEKRGWGEAGGNRTSLIH